ncbi:hypothetical protein BCT61_17325 [Vibrio breoganii]|uniref:glycosyltransferase family 4 protein n=1 Tax=Vibrio breoganii TaxID=553239 RepID=UPI000CB70D71|nr:glycosyltransferase family 4 protein [Vibrio breoganii]PMM04014.1 hypothetical protein BCT61_17325 [Vibrio breoganii]
MKVLFVYGGNNNPMPFIHEQKESLLSKGLEVDDFLIKGHGVFGYLSNLYALNKKIDSKQYQLIHAHYGLSGLLANLQRKLPVVTTFHGSDVYLNRNKLFSSIASLLSSHSIFVNNEMVKKIYSSSNLSVIPCGVNTSIFHPQRKIDARNKLGFDLNNKYALFTSSFSNSIKNYPLAKLAVDSSEYDIKLIELKNRTREEVNLLLNGCDFLLMTSFSEGSPQIIKEAIATNMPIISTDVGDVKAMIDGLSNCHITNFEIEDIANAIDSVLSDNKRSNGRDIIFNLDLNKVASRIIDLYSKIAVKK